MMKQLSKIAAFLLVLLILSGTIPAASASDTSIPYGMEYIIADGSVTITKYSGYAKNLTVPETIEGLPVTCIDRWAFYTQPCMENLESVVLPDSITDIREYAFYSCYKLAQINIPKNLEVINTNTFYSCKSLRSISLPDALTSIESEAFSFCSSLESITIPKTVTNIGERALYGCSSISSIVVEPENENYISQNDVLFNKDKTTLIQYSLGSTDTSYVIPDSITTIGAGAFYSSQNLTSVTIPEGVEKLEFFCFADCTKLTEVTLPDSTKFIGGLVFGDCSSLSKITLGKGLETISQQAFEHCTALESIYIPEKVKSIEFGTFRYCSSLTEINVAPNNSDFSSVNGVLFNKDKTELIQYPAAKPSSSYTVPYQVTTICEYAFEDSSSVDEVILSDNTTTIGESAFFRSNLKTIHLTDSLTTIENGAFSCCQSLSSVVIPDSVTTLGKYTFHACDNLKSVTIGNGITDIPDRAFQYCEMLENIIFGDNVKTIGEFAFDGCDSLSNVVIPDSVTTLGKYTFNACDNLKSVTIGNGITEIPDRAFQYCETLENIIIGNNVTTIGHFAFGDCDNLRNIVIPATVTAITPSAFGDSPDPVTIYGFEGSYAETFASEESFPFVPLAEITDTESNISVTTSVGTNLEVKNITDTEKTSQVNIILDSGVVTKLYDITLTKNNEQVQPDVYVTVKIPTDNPDIKVYRVEDDGTITNMNAVYSDGYLVFVTDHFSLYALSDSALIIGDVNMDGNLNVKDATAIQKHIAGINILGIQNLAVADYNYDSSINIKDATAIQKKIAGLL